MRKLFVIPFLLFALSVEAAPPSRQSTYTTGTVISSSAVTSNEDSIFNYLQSGVDEFADGTIVNADIHSSANIQSDKLNLTAIAQSVANSGSTTLTGTFAANGTTNSIGNGGSDVLTLNVPGGMTLSAATTWTLTGALTFSGTIADLGIVTTADINGGTMDGVQIGGTTATGELLVNDASDDADGLGSQGTSGQFLQSAGAGANPTFVTLPRIPYFVPDSTVVLAFDNGESAFDLSLYKNVITLTNLDYTKFAAGKVSNICYDFDGTTDYAVVTLNALWNTMNKYTLELWFYKDTTGTMHILDDSAGTDFFISVSNTNIRTQVDLTGGALDLNSAHGLASNGTGAWVYLVITYDGTTLKYYVNGVVNGTTATSSGSTQNIGALTIGALAAGTEAWDGKIDGFRLLRNQVFSAADILARYTYYNSL